LKKGIIHINLARSWRGGERQVALLMDFLKRKEVRQLLICTKGSSLQGYCEEKQLPYKCYSGLALFIYVPFLIAWLHALKRFALIHCHESRGHTLAFLARFVFRSSIKMIVHRRVLFPIRSKRVTLLKYSPKYADRIICISKAVEQVVKEAIPNSNTVVIPSGVPLRVNSDEVMQDLRKNYNIASSAKIVAYIAALSYEKDHYTFLDTAKSVLNQCQDVYFMIIGDGVLRQELVDYATKLKIIDKVVFTGFLSDVNQIIKQTDVLLFTSKSEGLGSTILDYFVNRRPVISARNGGAEELIVDGETGFLCPVGDVACFSQKLQILLNNTADIERITNNAYAFVENNFSIETIARKILNLYSEL